jgi:hypothetical protein
MKAKIQSRVNIFIHVAVLASLTLAVLIAGWKGWTKIKEARSSVTLLQKGIDDNKSRLSRGKIELERATKRNSSALVIMNRVEAYKKLSSDLLANDGANFKKLVETSVTANKLNNLSFESQSPGSQKFGNYNYDGRSFTLVARGTYRDMGAMLAELENNVPLMEITNISVSEDVKTPKQLLGTFTFMVITDIQEARVKSGGKK